jgi:hypothetical protein
MNSSSGSPKIKHLDPLKRVNTLEVLHISDTHSVETLMTKARQEIHGLL